MYALSSICRRQYRRTRSRRPERLYLLEMGRCGFLKSIRMSILYSKKCRDIDIFSAIFRVEPVLSCPARYNQPLKIAFRLRLCRKYVRNYSTNF